MLRPNTEITNCYKLQSQLADYPLAEEWAASAIYSPHRFVLKFFKPGSLSTQAMERYRRDAMRYYGLRRDGIVPVIESDIYQGRLFVCSEYYGEETLARRLVGAGETELSLACELVERIARTVVGLHECGLVVANLSPDILRLSGGGLDPAAIALQVPGDYTLYAEGLDSSLLAPGRPCFLAPELRAGADIGPACDVYSLGALLAWLVTRVEPPPGQCELAWPEAMRQRRAPEGLIALTAKALAGAPGRRHDSSWRFLEDLLSYLRSLGSDKPRPWAADELSIPLQSPAPASRPTLRWPEAVAHAEVIKYFQELSSEYFSAPTQAKAGRDLSASGGGPAGPGYPPQRPPLPVPLYGPEPKKSAEQAGENLPTLPPAAADPGDGLGASSLPLPGGGQIPAVPRPASTNASLSWQYRKVSMDAVLDTLRLSAKRARRARGEIRFIEEPNTPAAFDRLDALFASLSDSALVVDVGSMLRFGSADVTDFFCAYRQALSRALEDESRRSLRRFGRIAERLGVRRYFGAYPLGALVFGEDGQEEPVDRDDFPAIIEAIASFGRRNRPLLLIVRGGECLQASLTDFFLLMTPLLRSKPVCLFVFGEDFPDRLKREAKELGT